MGGNSAVCHIIMVSALMIPIVQLRKVLLTFSSEAHETTLSISAGEQRVQEGKCRRVELQEMIRVDRFRSGELPQDRGNA